MNIDVGIVPIALVECSSNESGGTTNTLCGPIEYNCLRSSEFNELSCSRVTSTCPVWIASYGVVVEKLDVGSVVCHFVEKSTDTSGSVNTK